MAMIDGHFFSTGQIFMEGLHGQVFLMEINPDTGDTLSFLQQGNVTQELAGGILPTSDGNFILFNMVSSPGNTIWLQKRTPHQEVLWDVFPQATFNNQGIGGIVELSNGDFLFTNYTCTGSCFRYGLSITRTDSAGSEIWTSLYPEETSSNTIRMAHITGDTVAISWGRNLWAELDSVAPYPPSILWYNGEAEEIGRYNFTADFKRVIFNIRKSSDGGIIGVGYVDRRSSGLGILGWVFRISPQGLLQWQRYITYQDAPESNSAFYDLTEDPDGSLVLTGRHSILPSHPDAGISRTNAWLVRLDSTGCFEPGCGSTQLITGGQEAVQQEQERRVLVFPNPTGASFSLLMEGYPQPVYPVRAKMWDMQGRLLEERTVGAPSEIWYCEDRPPGVYWIQVHTSAGQVGVAKLVKR